MSGLPNLVTQRETGGGGRVYTVADAAARLALSASEGDEAIQTDDNSQWLFDGTVWIQRAVSGGSGDLEEVCVPFQYNSTSPLVIDNIVAGQKVVNSEIEILTPFDDPGAVLRLGTFADDDLIMTEDMNNPQIVHLSVNHDNFEFLVNDSVILTISPGTSTQGSGKVNLTIDRS